MTDEKIQQQRVDGITTEIMELLRERGIPADEAVFSLMATMVMLQEGADNINELADIVREGMIDLHRELKEFSEA